MNAHWTKIDENLQNFQSMLAPNAPKLCIKEGFCKSNKMNSDDLKSPGVYLLFDSTFVLNYIGSATCQWMLDRVKNYRNPKHKYFPTLEYIDVIPFQSGWHFFAPALEYYLIEKTNYDRHLKGEPLLKNSIGTAGAFIKYFNEVIVAARDQKGATAPCDPSVVR